jgi:Ca-activated chloride channel family protein
MEILNPYAFLFLAFLPLFFKRNNKQITKIVLYSSKNYFFLIAYLFLIIAFSRPVINNGKIKVKLPKTNIVVAIDISKNMLNKDFYPNDLEFVKNKFLKFLDYLKDENVAVILFNQNVYMLTPFSRDYDSILYNPLLLRLRVYHQY